MNGYQIVNAITYLQTRFLYEVSHIIYSCIRIITDHEYVVLRCVSICSSYQQGSKKTVCKSYALMKLCRHITSINERQVICTIYLWITNKWILNHAQQHVQIKKTMSKSNIADFLLGEIHRWTADSTTLKAFPCQDTIHMYSFSIIKLSIVPRNFVVLIIFLVSISLSQVGSWYNLSGVYTVYNSSKISIYTWIVSYNCPNITPL